MLDPIKFAEVLGEHFGVVAGVPDSLLKPINTALQASFGERFYTTCNEGQAIAFACGYHLATGKLGLVYLQNSGLGIALNPILSLADPMVYSIPLVMMIGVRGGQNDEPQHRKQGLVTKAILDACEIKYIELCTDFDEAKEQVRAAKNLAQSSGAPVALLVQKGTFEPYKLADSADEKAPQSPILSLNREGVIERISRAFAGGRFIATTGMISRELYEIRERYNEGHGSDFLVLGSMGHASSLAYIISKNIDKRVICLDGDGAFLMHMGSITNFKGGDFVHIVLNNYAHDSVGGQATNAKNVDFCAVALACGYDIALSADSEEGLNAHLQALKGQKGLCFLEVKVAKGGRKDIGRPKDALGLKEAFCKGL